MDNSPIILIGAARSGTKFLRDVLAQDPAINRVPYDVNYIWRTGQLGKDDDVLEPDSIDDARAKKIRRTIQKLSSVADGSDIQIIEKSVSNTLRVPFVDRVFPNARYVHLVRNGYATIESSHRMWQEPPDKTSLLRKLRDLPVDQYGYILWFALNYIKGLTKGRSGGEVWGPRYPGMSIDVTNEDLLVVIARQWNWCVQKAHAELATLPAERVMTIRFEDLAGNQQKMTELAKFAGASNVEATVEAINIGFDVSNVDKWRTRLTAQEIRIIEHEASDSLVEFGYHEGKV